MKLEVPVKVDIDDVTKLIHDLQCLQTYKLGVNDTMVLVSLDDVADVFADHIRAKRLDKDIDVPSKSALDHIHNVVRDDAYKRGYEQGKADAAPTWIPTSERVPSNNDTVLIVHKGGVSTGWWNGRYWERGASSNHRMLKTVTHWMPFPEAPKGE